MANPIVRVILTRLSRVGKRTVGCVEVVFSVANVLFIVNVFVNNEMRER